MHRPQTAGRARTPSLAQPRLHAVCPPTDGATCSAAPVGRLQMTTTAVSGCARPEVRLETSNAHAVARIFVYAATPGSVGASRPCTTANTARSCDPVLDTRQPWGQQQQLTTRHLLHQQAAVQHVTDVLETVTSRSSAYTPRRRRCPGGQDAHGGRGAHPPHRAGLSALRDVRVSRRCIKVRSGS